MVSLDRHPAAEQFAADLRLLSHGRKEERIRGCERVVQAGSAAVLPLLKVAVYDKWPEVRDAAMWSVVRLADDLQGETEIEAAAIAAHLEEASRSLDPFVRLGAAVARVRQGGGSAAKEAIRRINYFDDGMQAAAFSLLERMVREEPDRDADLEAVLVAAKRHRYSAVRERAEELLELLTGRRGVQFGTTGPSALVGGSLGARRLAVELIVADEESAPRLLFAANLDPDRTVRHAASIKLFGYLRGGASVDVPEGLRLRGDEARVPFRYRDGVLKANGAMLSFYRVTLESGTTVEKRRALRLLLDLGDVLRDGELANLDGLIRVGLRDKDREVRRHAARLAKFAPQGETFEELTGRLRQQLRCSPPRYSWFVIASQLGLAIALFVSGNGVFVFGGVMLLDSLLRLPFVLAGRRAKHQMTDEEYFETLCALEPVAESRPETLRSALPQLRTLSSLMGSPSPAVRAKARELLAKVHESELHELPIAAASPAVELEALPIPGAAPEVCEVVAR